MSEKEEGVLEVSWAWSSGEIEVEGALMGESITYIGL